MAPFQLTRGNPSQNTNFRFAGFQFQGRVHKNKALATLHTKYHQFSCIAGRLLFHSLFLRVWPVYVLFGLRYLLSCPCLFCLPCWLLLVIWKKKKSWVPWIRVCLMVWIVCPHLYKKLSYILQMDSDASSLHQTSQLQTLDCVKLWCLTANVYNSFPNS